MEHCDGTEGKFILHHSHGSVQIQTILEPPKEDGPATPKVETEEEVADPALAVVPDPAKTGASPSAIPPRKRLKRTEPTYPAHVYAMPAFREKWVHSGRHIYKATSNSDELVHCPVCALCFHEFMLNLDEELEIKPAIIVASQPPRLRELGKSSETGKPEAKEPETTSKPSPSS